MMRSTGCTSCAPLYGLPLGDPTDDDGGSSDPGGSDSVDDSGTYGGPSVYNPYAPGTEDTPGDSGDDSASGGGTNYVPGPAPTNGGGPIAPVAPVNPVAPVAPKTMATSTKWIIGGIVAAVVVGGGVALYHGAKHHRAA